MIIGVVADTHSRTVPKQLVEDFKKVDLIIHAGDFCSLSDLKFFTDLKEVKAVYGNMDEPKLRQKLPEKTIFKLEGCAIGLFHGESSPQKVLDVVKEKFKDDKVDAVVFGHSHISLNRTIGGVLYFNPGSPNDTVCAPYCSYGLLEIKDKKIVGKIIRIKD